MVDEIKARYGIHNLHIDTAFGGSGDLVRSILREERLGVQYRRNYPPDSTII